VNNAYVDHRAAQLVHHSGPTQGLFPIELRRAVTEVRDSKDVADDIISCGAAFRRALENCCVKGILQLFGNFSVTLGAWCAIRVGQGLASDLCGDSRLAGVVEDGVQRFLAQAVVGICGWERR
jgi:hypothetical protein